MINGLQIKNHTHLSLLMAFFIGLILSNVGWHDVAIDAASIGLFELGMKAVLEWRDSVYQLVQIKHTNHQLTLAFSELLSMAIGTGIAVLAIIRAGILSGGQACNKIYRLEQIRRGIDSVNSVKNISDLKRARLNIYFISALVLLFFLVLGFYVSPIFGNKILSLFLLFIAFVFFLGPPLILISLQMVNIKIKNGNVSVKELIITNKYIRLAILLTPYIYLTFIMLFILYIHPEEIFKILDLNVLSLSIYIFNLFMLFSVGEIISRVILFVKSRKYIPNSTESQRT